MLKMLSPRVSVATPRVRASFAMASELVIVHLPEPGSVLFKIERRFRRRRRTPGQFTDFEGDHAVERLRFALAAIPLKTAKPIAASFANFAGLKRITSLEVAHLPQSLRSVRSFLFGVLACLPLHVTGCIFTITRKRANVIDHIARTWAGCLSSGRAWMLTSECAPGGGGTVDPVQIGGQGQQRQQQQ